MHRGIVAAVATGVDVVTSGAHTEVEVADAVKIGTIATIIINHSPLRAILTLRCRTSYKSGNVRTHTRALTRENTHLSVVLKV